MSSNADVVDRFVAAWQTHDLDAIMAFFAEDAVYTNIPIDPPNVGAEMIRTTIGGFLGMAEKIDFVVHHQGETPSGAILNERTDRFLIKGQWVEAGVMGVFEIEGGKIKAWRDYFDMGQFQTALAGAGN